MRKGERIKICREQMDLTLEDLSKLVGVSRQTLSRYETGVINTIPSDRIEDLARVLNTTPSYIMGWDELDKKIEDNKAEEAKKENDPPQDFSFYYDLSEEGRAKLMEVAQFLLAQQNKE